MDLESGNDETEVQPRVKIGAMKLVTERGVKLAQVYRDRDLAECSAAVDVRSGGDNCHSLPRQ